MKRKDECLICRAPLQYRKYDTEMECVVISTAQKNQCIGIRL